MFENVSKPEEREKTYRCPCCRYKTLYGRGGYEICKVCFWEDDGQDDHDADEVRGGPSGGEPMVAIAKFVLAPAAGNANHRTAKTRRSMIQILSPS